MILQVGDLTGIAQQFAFLNVGITEGKGILHRQPAADGCPGSKGGSDDKGIFSLPELIRRQNAAPYGGSVGNPRPQSDAVALADHVQHGLFQIIGVVHVAVRRFGVIRKCCLRMPLLPGAGNLLLHGIQNGNIGKGGFLVVQDVVDGAQHLHNTFHGHVDNAQHSGCKAVHIICCHIGAECQLPQFLLGVRDLPGGADYDLDFSGIDDAIAVKMLRGEIADMLCDAQNFLLIQHHGVLGKIHNGMIKNLYIILENSHRNSGQIPQHCTKIANIQLFHTAPPN